MVIASECSRRRGLRHLRKAHGRAGDPAPQAHGHCLVGGGRPGGAGQLEPQAHRRLGKGGPIGDKIGPDSQRFSFRNVALKKGELIRWVIDPNRWWGSDLTQIEDLTIERMR